MKVVYRAHAIERMVKRKIDPTDVELVILTPDGTIKQTADKKIFYKRIKGRKDNDVAVVALEVSKKYYEVITVMVNFEVYETH